MLMQIQTWLSGPRRPPVCACYSRSSSISCLDSLLLTPSRYQVAPGSHVGNFGTSCRERPPDWCSTRRLTSNERRTRISAPCGVAISAFSLLPLSRSRRSVRARDRRDWPVPRRCGEPLAQRKRPTARNLLHRRHHSQPTIPYVEVLKVQAEDWPEPPEPPKLNSPHKQIRFDWISGHRPAARALQRSSS